MIQISNKIFCEKFLTKLDIKTKILPNPYRDYPFMIIKGFLPSKTCEEINVFVKKNNETIDAQIRNKNGIKIDKDLNKSIRKTKIHKLDSVYRKIYELSFLKHKEDIEVFFNLPLSKSTKIQLLEYTKGSFYKQHCDDSSVILKNKKIVGFFPVALERKVTTVLFTTSHSDIVSDKNFRGGELIFNYLYDEEGEQVQIKPELGDMIVFLSNPYFTHEVSVIEEGSRISLVQWHDAIVT